MGLRWRNVPLPQGHVTGLVLGLLLQHLFPLRFGLPGWIRRGIGWPLVLLGVGLSLWSLIQAGEAELSAPDTLLTTGPYAVSRNPMYVGWTLLYTGVGLASDAAWALACLPPVVAYNHFVEIRKEEDTLEHEWGDEYRAYRRRVRRYL